MATEKQPTKAAMLKKTSNYLKIIFSYNLSIVLPYKEGIALLEHLEFAEMYNTDNYEHHKIIEIDRENQPITSEVISQEKYLECKMSALLNIE